MNSDYQRPPIRVALLGLGRVVFEEHYPVLKAHPALFNVVAACDLQKERRDIIEADFPKCRMFRRFDDMLNEREIDLVVIATPSTERITHVNASLSAQRWTMVESPLALSYDAAQRIRGAAVKAGNRLIVANRGMFSIPYLIAKQMVNDLRLGRIYDIRLRCEDYIRRDDWFTIRRMGGGASFYAMPDVMMQVLKLLPSPPIQMWSDLKRIASLGDSEDYAHVTLKTRADVSADIEYNGGMLNEARSPAIEIRGERGVFRIMQGADSGELVCIDPDFDFPRRRSSVRTPPLGDMHEAIPVKRMPITLEKGANHGASAFWRSVYASVRTGAAFPISLEDTIEAIKFAELMKKSSTFGK